MGFPKVMMLGLRHEDRQQLQVPLQTEMGGWRKPTQPQTRRLKGRQWRGRGGMRAPK